jgi:hypothetical protein
LTTVLTVPITFGVKTSLEKQNNNDKCDLQIYVPIVDPITGSYVIISTSVFYRNYAGSGIAPPIGTKFSVAFFYNQETSNPFKIVKNCFFKEEPTPDRLPEEVPVSFGAKIPKGVTQISAKVDYDNNIDESNEDNNYATSAYFSSKTKDIPKIKSISRLNYVDNLKVLDQYQNDTIIFRLIQKFLVLVL